MKNNSNKIIYYTLQPDVFRAWYNNMIQTWEENKKKKLNLQ